MKVGFTLLLISSSLQINSYHIFNLDIRSAHQKIWSITKYLRCLTDFKILIFIEH